MGVSKCTMEESISENQGWKGLDIISELYHHAVPWDIKFIFNYVGEAIASKGIMEVKI